MFYNNAWTFCNFIENKLTTLQQSNIKQSMSKYLFQLKLIILLRQIRIISQHWVPGQEIWKTTTAPAPQGFLEPPGCLVIMGPMEFKERKAQRGREGTPVTLGSKVRHAPFYYLEGGEYDINIIIVSLGFHVRFCQTVCCHGL